MSGKRYLLFLHGIRNDDPDRTWLDALNASLRREGLKTVEERGLKVIQPTYLDLLEMDSEPEAQKPTQTYKPHDDDVRRRAATRYWLALDSLEAHGIRRDEAPQSRLAALPADGVHADLIEGISFKDANRYRRSPARRNAVLQRILKDLPGTGELVIIAHSLGSVVAGDLIYHLPPRRRLQLLVTIGTPLGLKAMRKHLEDANRRFPYETMGPWINVVGAGDLVTGYRGLSRVQGQALDIFIDTGGAQTPRQAHQATRYLDNSTAAIALEWQATQAPAEPDERPLPDKPLPRHTMAMLIGAQFGLRAGQAMKSNEARTRFVEARQLVLSELAQKLADAGIGTVSADQLARDQRAWFHTKTIGDDELIANLLSAFLQNPIARYEIDLSRDERLDALRKLATDLGKTKHFAEVVADAERAARASHKESKFTLKRAGLAIAGVAVVVAAPYLVLAAAPAGITGAAAIVAGLTALGPGGMLGGIGIVSLLGGAGGVTAGRALMTGTPAQVEETVIFLQALAKARQDLARADLAITELQHSEWFALIEMEDVATDEHERLALYSDNDAAVVKELERKLRSVRRALVWMEEQGLGPKLLPATAGGE